MYEESAMMHKYNTGAPEIRQTEVQSEITRLVDLTERLDKGMIDLEAKLSPVLAQHKVAGTDAQGTPTPLRVPLAEVLHTRGDHLDMLLGRLSSIVSRLEV